MKSENRSSLQNWSNDSLVVWFTVWKCVYMYLFVCMLLLLFFVCLFFVCFLGRAKAGRCVMVCMYVNKKRLYCGRECCNCEN